jgi:hypothetical protein
MAKNDGVNPHEFDSRMIEWNLKHNRVTKDQLKAHLSSLPDDAANCETIELDETSPGNGIDSGPEES